jgi:hypothetical protein
LVPKEGNTTNRCTRGMLLPREGIYAARNPNPNGGGRRVVDLRGLHARKAASVVLEVWLAAGSAGVAPTRKTPIVVWRATTTRLSGERVRPVCGLCGFVCLSRASHWSHHPHPLHPPVRRPRAGPRPGRVTREVACGPRSQQPTSATAPVSITHHHHRSLARVIARSEERPAEPGPHSAAARRAPQPQPGAGAPVRGRHRTV